jgi:hypothetical protein
MQRRQYDYRHAAIQRHYRDERHMLLPAVEATEPDESDQHFDINQAWRLYRVKVTVVVGLWLLSAMFVGVYIGHWMWR